MPADEGTGKPLAERIVKEAITLGLETPMREPILEAIDEAGEGKKNPSRTIPMAGTLLGLGAAAGYLLGGRDTDFDVEDVPIDDLEEPDVIEDVVGEDGDDDEEEELEEESSGSLLRPLLLGLGIVAAVVFARRKLGSGDDEWEPIEEFETADDDEFGGDFGSDDDDEFGGDFGSDDDDEFGGDFGSDDFDGDDEDEDEDDEEVEVEEEAE